MTITAKYPASLATMTDYTDTGVGREKSNDKDPRHLTKNIIGPEYSQLCGELIATQKFVGTELSEPASYGDDCLGSHQETLEWMVMRADKAFASDHFVFNAYTTAFFSTLNTAGSYTSVAGGVGVGQVVLGAGLREGFTQATYHFNERTTYMRCRWRLSDIPVGAADLIEIGIEDAAAHFVKFHVTNPTAPTNWTVEIDNGGVGDSDVLTVTPVADTWYTFELLTSATGATFWYERGTANEQKVELVAAPFDGVCRPVYAVTQAAGGFFMFCDYIGIADTRPL